MRASADHYTDQLTAIWSALGAIREQTYGTCSSASAVSSYQPWMSVSQYGDGIDNTKRQFVWLQPGLYSYL